MQSLKVVMLIGQAVSLAPALVLFLFDDDKALGEESAPLTGRPSMPQLGAFAHQNQLLAGVAKRQASAGVSTHAAWIHRPQSSQR